MEGEEREKAKQLDRLMRAIERVYHNPSHIIWRGFLIGLASGVGGVIGVALVIGLLGFLVRALGGLPVIGQWLINVQHNLPTERL